MTNNPTPAPPPVNTSKIKIEISKLDAPDYQLDFDMPLELVTDIYERLKDGEIDYDEGQMTSLLTKICLDEGMIRFDKNSIWGPKLMPETEPAIFNEGSGFVFSAIVDATPTDALSDISSIPIERRKLEVTDELVDAEMFEQQLLFGTRAKHTGEIAFGDELTCKAMLTVDDRDEAVFSIDDCKIRVPKDGQQLTVGTFHCNEGEQLRGKQVGDTISISFSLRDTPATLVLENSTAERITPCSVEEVIKQYGSPNETILKSQIKLSLQRNFDRQNKVRMGNQLFNFLLETLDLPISKRIIDGNFQDMCKAELKKQEGQGELSQETKDGLLKKAQTVTKRRVISICFQEHFNLMINEEDIQQQICDIAESRRVRPEVVQEEFVSGEAMNVLGNMVMEKKIFDRLKDKMVFTDI